MTSWRISFVTIEQNILARKAAQDMMELGIDLCAETKLEPNAVRHFWKIVRDNINDLIGKEEVIKEPEPITIKQTDWEWDGVMPFGKYKDEDVSNVPESYLNWLSDQEWISEWPDVYEYLNENGYFL